MGRLSVHSALSSACAVLLVCSAPARAQSVEEVALHSARLAAERGRLVLDAWAVADEPQRAAARLTLERLRRPGAPAGAPPSPLALARAWRALTSDPAAPARDPEQEALEILVESLDVTLIPGCFAARTEGPGEPLRVHVATVADARPAHELEVVLWWLPPQAGAAPIQARRAQAFPDAFGAQGFDLFLGAPQCAEPAPWRLVVELVSSERRAFGLPLEVECLRDPAALSAVAEDDAPAQRALAREVARCLEVGRPASPGPPLAELAGQRSDHTGEFVLLSPDGQQGSAPQWVWRPSGELRLVLIVLAPARELPSAVFAGELGRRWRKTASELGALVLPLGLARSTSARPFAQLPQRLDVLAPGASQLPRLLVARGDSAAYLALAFGEQAPPFDAWVLAWGGAGQPRLPWPKLRARVLASAGPLEPEALDEKVATRTWQRGESCSLLDELLLPQLTAQLARELAADSQPRTR